MKFLTFYLLLTTYLMIFGSVAAAQTPSENDMQWTRLKDEKVDISVLFPPNFVVDAEPQTSIGLGSSGPKPKVIDVSSTEKPRIYGSRKGCSMRLNVREFPKSSSAENYLFFQVDQNAAKDNYQDFRVGKFVGRKTNYDTDKRLSTTIIIAADNKIFTIYASARKEDSQTYIPYKVVTLVSAKV